MSTAPAPRASDPRRQRFLKYPLGVGSANVLVTTNAEDHLRDLILQVLLTNPGERINVPEFGAGVRQLIFEPGNDAVAASAQFLISTALQRWLGDRIDVGSVSVDNSPGDDQTITITVDYVAKSTQRPQTMTVLV